MVGFIPCKIPEWFIMNKEKIIQDIIDQITGIDDVTWNKKEKKYAKKIIRKILKEFK